MELLRLLGDGIDLTNGGHGTLVLADKPQPAPNSPEKRHVFAYPLQCEAQSVGTTTILARNADSEDTMTIKC